MSSALLMAGDFGEVRSSTRTAAADTTTAAAAVDGTPTGESESDEFWLVEQMVREDLSNGSSSRPATPSVEVRDALLGGGSGGATTRWAGEQRGRCWLDVTRGVWYRDKEEATPIGTKIWSSGWRIVFDHVTDDDGWQYANAWLGGSGGWGIEVTKTTRVRRRKWARTMRAPSSSSSSRAPCGPSLTSGVLLTLAGGQHLIHGDMGTGSPVSLVFDLSQLSLRPAIEWKGSGSTNSEAASSCGAPDAITAIPPLLLAYHANTRTLYTYHIATGERLHSIHIPQPATTTANGPGGSLSVQYHSHGPAPLSATDWLDAMGDGMGGHSPPSSSDEDGDESFHSGEITQPKL